MLTKRDIEYAIEKGTVNRKWPVDRLPDESDEQFLRRAERAIGEQKTMRYIYGDQKLELKRRV